MTREGDEVFHFMRWTWNVTRAWELVGDREPVEVPVSALAPLLRLLAIDLDHLPNVDVTKPLLAAPYPDDMSVNLVIDGWHRVARAVQEGIEKLPMVPMTEDEAKEVMSEAVGRSPRRHR